MVPEFEEKMLIRGARIIRSSTLRRDLSFSVSDCAPNCDFVLDFAVPHCQEVNPMTTDLDGRALGKDEMAMQSYIRTSDCRSKSNQF